MRLWHFITNRNRARDGQTRPTSVCEEIERRLCAHFHLAHHVWEQLQRRRGAYLSTKPRSEEHTSELQSRFDLVCRLLLEKKKIQDHISAVMYAGSCRHVALT